MPSWFDFLKSRGAHIDDTRVADFGDRARELAATRDGTILSDLSSNALIGVSGDDAASFLQGQLTNDVNELPADAAQWTGWCTPKGRLLATFLLMRMTNAYLLMLPAEIAAPIRKRLSMFVLRSKVKLEDVGDAWVRIGLAGPGAAAAIARRFGRAPDPMKQVRANGSAVVSLNHSRFLLLAPPADAPALWEALSHEATEAGANAWEWTSIRAGIPAVVAATQEAFVPQMANFDLIGAVSFHKGCYPGQEIVARMQYRGILKRRMALAHGEADSPPQPGESVYSAAFGDQAAGTIANAADRKSVV